MDRYDLYEQCVQSPDELVPLLRAIHGGAPATLGEDFCGTAAISRAWLELVPGGRAIAVDHDPEPLARLGDSDRLIVVRGDVCRDTEPEAHRADLIWVGNFSIGEWHERGDLLAYLRHAHARLAPGGIFACDLYGGESAFLVGALDRDCPLSDGRVATYTWQQVDADALTGQVVTALHFVVRRDGQVEQRLDTAFRYDWRLWGVPELRDALREAGFATPQVYPRVPDAIDDEGEAFVTPISGDELEDSFDVIVAARRPSP